MTAGEIAAPVRSMGAAASRAIREITSTVGCLLILPGARLASRNGREHAMRIGFPGTGTAGRHLRPEVAGPGHEVPPEPDTMDQDMAELAYRRGAGIEVTLLWHRTSGELTVSVTDAASGASFELPSLLTRRSPPSTTPMRTPPPRECPTRSTSTGLPGASR
jgi:hypothetical protein